jgi:hypothetical protein
MDTFEQINDKMHLLLTELSNKPMYKRGEIGVGRAVIPQKGIYVLFENGKPIYVGRSNNIKQRLSGHGSQSSDRFSATFAFRLAIKEFEKKYPKSTKGILRQDLENDQNFAVIFKKAKARVAEMGIRAIEIDDQITQTIFEVYASMKLGTLEFNSFDNH